LGYYRKCVQNDARIAKLLTKYLQGQNGKASKKHHPLIKNAKMGQKINVRLF